MRRCERRCEDEKMWRGADVKRSRCEEEQMWRWEDVKMSRCEDEKVWEKVRRWEDVKMRRCERRCEDEKVWRWEGVREDVKMRRCEDEKMWRWEDVKMSRCEDEEVWEKVRRWEDVKMRRCERRCEDEKVWRWEGVREDVKMRRCEDEKMWRWADVKVSRCEDEKVWEKVWRWEGVKMRRWDTDPHYWKNPALRRSREKYGQNPVNRWWNIIYIVLYQKDNVFGLLYNLFLKKTTIDAGFVLDTQIPSVYRCLKLNSTLCSFQSRCCYVLLDFLENQMAMARKPIRTIRWSPNMIDGSSSSEIWESHTVDGQKHAPVGKWFIIGLSMFIPSYSHDLQFMEIPRVTLVQDFATGFQPGPMCSRQSWFHKLAQLHSSWAQEGGLEPGHCNKGPNGDPWGDTLGIFALADVDPWGKPGRKMISIPGSSRR